MKLIYIYFDFTDNGHNPEGYRGFKKCGFNFGIKDYFKMEEPTEEHPNYRLTCTPRPEDEQIEPGFWGDPRLYNISALVGDNGVGKSTIIQGIIRCVMGSSKIGKTKYGEKYTHYRPFVSVWENTDGTYTVYHSIVDIDFDKLSLSKNILINYEESQEVFFGKTKLIYFSNALTGSDTQLLADLGRPCFDEQDDNEDIVDHHNTYYTSPLYNCSLSADIAQAVKVSYNGTKYYNAGIGDIGDIYDTYFNFRSYQEARFLFDRNQRKQLFNLQEQYHFPVPVPRLLKLNIASPLVRIRTIIDRELFPETYISDGESEAEMESEAEIFSQYFSSRGLQNDSNKHFGELESHLRQIYEPGEKIISTLCMNCIASLYISSGNVYFPKIDLFSGKNASSYKNLLDEILKVNQKNKNAYRL